MINQSTSTFRDGLSSFGQVPGGHADYITVSMTLGPLL